MARTRVKSKPFFPYTYTATDSNGTVTKNSPNLGTELLDFEGWVDPSGNLWVRAAGTTATGGTGPSGAATTFLTDVLGNQRVALPDIASGTTPLPSTSIAYESSRLVKSTAGVLFGVAGYNSKASTQFILVLNFGGATVPANGTVPVDIIAVSAASNFSIDFGRWGRPCSAGIWLANSSTGPTLTIGSADTWFDALYV